MIPLDAPSYIARPNYIPIVEAGLFLLAWMVREFMWSKEREKLLDRLMAKSLPEFKYEERKAEIVRRQAVPKPAATDEELARWEQAHISQVATNAAELDAKLEALKKKAKEAVHAS